MGEVVAGNKLDKDMQGKVNVKRSKFPISNWLHGTYRFGEYGICLVEDGQKADKFAIRSTSDVDSYTLKAPLKTPIYMNKDYYMVPRMAILPNAWEKIDVAPTIGEDIDATEYGTSVKAEYWNAYCSKLNLNWSKWVTEDYTSAAYNDDFDTIAEALEAQIYTANLMEKIFSQGGLCAAMGMNWDRAWSVDTATEDENKGKNFDEILEKFLSFPQMGGFKITDRDTNETFLINVNLATDVIASKKTTERILSINEFWTKIKDGMRIQITKAYRSGGQEFDGEELGDWMNDLEEKLGYYDESQITVTPDSEPVDIAFLWAYQMTVAEFYTNDKVDYVYNCNLFREYIASLIKSFEDFETMSINGMDIPIDYLSAYYFKVMTNGLTIEEDIDTGIYAYINALFKYNRSLKFKDYFVGAKTRPLAIGQTEIQVVSNKVDVVDISVSIQRQRYWNVINKIERSLKGQGKGIFGIDVATDWHNPLALVLTREKIYGNEVENTGAAQVSQKVSRTTILASTGKNIKINVQLDRNAIILGIISFDVERNYSMGVDRKFRHVDRFDNINPYMQYTGDQDIKTSEFDIAVAPKYAAGTFGYTGNYMEYKQGINKAFGGFVSGALPGWIFLDRNVEHYHEQTLPMYKNVSPDFIRSKPSELDKFYISLNGHSMANYFHFIIDTYNDIEVTRDLAYNPGILG